VKHKLIVGSLVVLAGVGVAGAGSGAGAAPERELLVPGESLGGVRIGMAKAEVVSEWGLRFGRCRTCSRTTWYFNFKPFEAEGAGVSLEGGRVSHVFTLWQPDGWRTPEGLRIGEPAADIARTYGPLDRRECGHYYALVEPGGEAQTAYYVFDNEVWGFALTVPDASPCL
jgi:hypothetical protein